MVYFNKQYVTTGVPYHLKQIGLSQVQALRWIGYRDVEF